LANGAAYVFYEPKGIDCGCDQIDSVAGAIKATHPDSEKLGNGGRIQWVSGRPGEAPAYASTDFIIAGDGRIPILCGRFCDAGVTWELARPEGFETHRCSRDWSRAFHAARLQ